MKTEGRVSDFMRYRGALLLAVLLSVFLLLPSPGAAFAAQQRVFDEGDLFDGEEEEMLEEKLGAFLSKWQMDLGVLTTDDAGKKTTERLADDFYDGQGMGTGNSHSGALFVIDMDNREIYISTLGEMGNYLTDKRIEDILDDAYGYVSDGRYAECAAEAVDGISRYMEAGIPAGQHDYVRRDYGPSLRWYEILAAFIIAAATALLPCVGVMNQYKMKKEQKQALNYHFSYRGNSQFQFQSANDLFINKTVTQRRIPRNTGGSGPRGGSGSSAGRTTIHRSSSGRMHGGGGRKF